MNSYKYKMRRLPLINNILCAITKWRVGRIQIIKPITYQVRVCARYLIRCGEVQETKEQEKNSEINIQLRVTLQGSNRFIII